MTPDTHALAAHDTLLTLAPPLALVDYLDRLWAGRNPPEQWVRWLDRWKAIRAAESSIIDYVSVDEWKLIGEKIECTR